MGHPGRCLRPLIALEAVAPAFARCWHFLRLHYRADYVVVDAKNLSKCRAAAESRSSSRRAHADVARGGSSRTILFALVGRPERLVGGRRTVYGAGVTASSGSGRPVSSSDRYDKAPSASSLRVAAATIARRGRT